MTLWSIFRSPLIFGGDLPSNDAATTALITNDEVLEVDQHSSGGHQALERGNIRVWVANGERPRERYVAVFNLGEKPETADVAWSEIELRAPVAEIRDLWTHQPLVSQQGLHVNLRPHASALYRLTLSQ